MRRGRTRSTAREASEAPFALGRFLEAQDADAAFARALDELRRGRKTSHWMWFVFPQVAGLGTSATSRAFAISCLEEARAYLRHEVLGPRLLRCARLLAGSSGTSAEDLLGPVDARKLRSSMTLFLRAAPDEPLFQEVLDRYFDGRADPATDERL